MSAASIGNVYRIVSACGILLAYPVTAQSQKPSPDDFAQSIRPVLAQHCSACHNPANPKLRVNFLKASTAKDVEANRGLWRDVATQLRNRAMPPIDSKLTEDDRLRVVQWIDGDLRQSACDAGPFAGAVALRRLNRREPVGVDRDAHSCRGQDALSLFDGFRGGHHPADVAA